MKKYVLAICIACVSLLYSCQPQSKEAYLNEYKQFMQEVGKNGKNYSDSDWQKADDTFKEYSGTYYDLYKEDLSIREQLVVSKYILEYKVYKTSSKGTDVWDELFKEEDWSKIKDQLKSYRDNNMEEDLQRLQEKAESLGKNAEKEIHKILKELGVDTK